MANLISELKRRNVVRVAIAYVVLGWVTMQVGDVMFSTFEAPAWVAKSLAVLILLGFPFACLFAWAFELTPDGIRRTPDARADAALPPARRHMLDRVVIGVLVAALAYFIWERQVQDPGPDTRVTDKSIAVLPFLNLSSDTEEDWFVDGLTEEILNALARTPDLIVASRTSSFQFRDTDTSVAEIGRQLGVANILEGSMRRSGDRLRVSVQLVRAEDGVQLWSETIDRNREDVIEIQQDIAFEIANALHTAMDPAALREMVSAGTTSVAAYELYLEGVSLAARGSQTGNFDYWDEAMEVFDQSIVIDPQFALSHDFRARYWVAHLPGTLASSRLDLSPAELRQRAAEAMDAAIATAHDPIRAMRFRAWKASRELRLRDAKQEIEVYLERFPADARAVELYLGIAAAMRDDDAPKRFLDDAPRIARQNVGVGSAFIQYLTFSGHTDVALAIARERLRSTFRVFDAYQAHRALLWAGEVEDASELLQEVQQSNLPPAIIALARLRQSCAEGDEQSARATFDTLMENATPDATTRFFAMQIMGRAEEAHRTLVEANLEVETLGNLLSYPYFNQSYFPQLSALLDRQRIDRRYTGGPPYACAGTEDGNSE